MTDKRKIEERAIREAAHEWRTTLSLPGVSDAERAEFKAWLDADPRHETAFYRAETLFQAMGSITPETLGPEVMKRSVHESSPNLFISNKSGKFNRAIFASLAACILIVSLVSIHLWQPISLQSDHITDEILTYQTGVGELRSITLADGSTVILGAKSTLTASVAENKRSVRLDSGSAFFNVVPNQSRPFIVATDQLRVEVIGTSFDVRNNGGVARVAVAEGTVDVLYPLTINGELVNIKNQKRLTAGQQITATTSSGLSEIDQIDVSSVAAWREKRLIYKSATLVEIVADIARYSNVEVVLEDSNLTLHNTKISAFFDANDTQGMLDTLQDVLPVSVETTGVGKVIIRPLP